MTNRDAAAAESAELAALRDQAARDQQELGATVQALAARLRDTREVRARAGRAARQAARSGARAGWRAIRQRANGRPRGRGQWAVPVMVAVPLCTLAVAVTWRQVRARSARRRPGGRR